MFNNNSGNIFKRIAAIQTEWDLLSEKEKARRRRQVIEWSELLKTEGKVRNNRLSSDKDTPMKQ